MAAAPKNPKTGQDPVKASASRDVRSHTTAEAATSLTGYYVLRGKCYTWGWVCARALVGTMSYFTVYRDLPCNRWIFESDLTDFGRFRFPKFPVLILHRLLDVTSITDIARC